MQKHLLRYPSEQDPNVGARIAAREIIAASNLEIQLFDQGRPKQAGVVAVNAVDDAIRLGHGEPIINLDTSKGAVKVEPTDILAIGRTKRLFCRDICRVE